MKSPIALVSVGLFFSSYEVQNHFILEMEKYLYHTHLHVFHTVATCDHLTR